MTKKKPINKPAEHHYDLSQPEVKAIWDTAYAKGEKATEQRIIKLLEKQIEVHRYYPAIELIKGETK